MTEKLYVTYNDVKNYPATPRHDGKNDGRDAMRWAVVRFQTHINSV